VPIVDLAFDAGDDLIAQRQGSTQTDVKGQHPVFFHAELARSPGRYSHVE
jgi:hypothetical protein